jgi:WD40 repeat protein
MWLRKLFLAGNSFSDNSYSRRTQFPMKRQFSVLALFLFLVVSFSSDSLTNVYGLSQPDLPDQIIALDWHPDGDRVAVATRNRIEIWDVATAQILVSREWDGLREGPNDVQWSRFSNELLVVLSARTVLTLNGDNLQNVSFFDFGPGNVTWSLDESMMSIDVADSDMPMLRIVDTDTYETIVELRDSLLSSIEFQQWSRDGSRLAALDSSEAGVLVIWDTENWQVLERFEDALGWVALEWGADNTQLAVAGISGRIEVLDATTGETLKVLRPPEDLFGGSRIRWSPDYTRIALAIETSVWIFDVESGEIIDTFGTERQDIADNIGDIVWNPEGTEVVYGGGSVSLTFATPNQPPTANAGLDQTVTATDATAQVTLDASASSDPDGAIVSYEWREGGTLIASGVNPTVELAVGVHTLTLTVTDDEGASASDAVVITVRAPMATPAATDTPQP